MTDKATSRTTVHEDWNEYYGARDQQTSAWRAVDESDFRNHPHTSLLKFLAQYFEGGGVIEIGAGDSNLLIDVEKRFHPARVVGLDYLPRAYD